MLHQHLQVPLFWSGLRHSAQALGTAATENALRMELHLMALSDTSNYVDPSAPSPARNEEVLGSLFCLAIAHFSNICLISQTFCDVFPLKFTVDRATSHSHIQIQGCFPNASQETRHSEHRQITQRKTPRYASHRPTLVNALDAFTVLARPRAIPLRSIPYLGQQLRCGCNQNINPTRLGLCLSFRPCLLPTLNDWNDWNKRSRYVSKK